MDAQLTARLQSKSIKNSIITNIARDFNLTPILAEAYFTQIKDYFLQHADVKLSSGQIHYLAISDNEPAGKPVALCKKVSVFLTLHTPDDDLPAYKKSGLSGLRQHRLLRITKEAIEQGALLSYEDIAFILTTSIVTVKRDIAFMRKRGLVIPSRGWRHEMGRGQTHKTQILDLYLSGYQFSEIEKRTHHSETAVTRYIQDFSKIVLLHQKKFSVDQIRIATGFSNRDRCRHAAPSNKSAADKRTSKKSLPCISKAISLQPSPRKPITPSMQSNATSATSKLSVCSLPSLMTSKPSRVSFDLYRVSSGSILIFSRRMANILPPAFE